MKRRLLAMLLALVLVLSLTACGGSAAPEEEYITQNSTADAKTESAMDMAPMEEPMAEAEESYGAENGAYEDSGSGVAGPEGRKWICTAELQLETTEFNDAVQGLADLTERYEGWFESSSMGERGSGHCWADYVVRIPVKHYMDFLNQAGALCHETWRSTNQEDITEAYYDTEGRLKTQQIKLERLQELLSRAELMEDIITIESAISETEWQIDNLSGTLRRYDSLVDYATITISVQEVYKLSDVEEVPDSFASRLGKAFSNGMGSFVDSLEDLAIAFAYSWMWWLLVVAVVVLVVRRLRRRRSGGLTKWGRKKKAEPMDDKQDGI